MNDFAHRTLRSAEALAQAGIVPPEAREVIARVAERYSVALTPDLATLIDPADPADPIGRQFVPSAAELVSAPGEDDDPIGDDAHSPVKGIVHRYPDRVLLKPLHACAVYCRFCFRREMVGETGLGALSAAELEAAIAYIAADPAIWEVVVTGGDPLVLSPRRLAGIVARLAAIGHVRIVRFHTRVPVAEPGRVTTDLVAALIAPGLTTYVALHANHPRELTPAAREACARIVDAGIPMLGQTVLLKGVNDDPAVLEALFRALVETRVKPYYLHHGDLAPGTSHFRATIAEGQDLMRGLRGRVSGLCQPTYVLDIPGGYGKAPLGPSAVTHEGGGRCTVEDYRGAEHPYPPEAKLVAPRRLRGEGQDDGAPPERALPSNRIRTP